MVPHFASVGQTAMFNPSELEGEVDHSFFDSDCDDNCVSKDREKKTDRSLKTEKESLPPHETLHANTAGGLTPRTDCQEKHLKQVVDNNSRGAEGKENSCQSEEEVRSRPSSVSSVSTSHKVISSDSEEDSNLHSKKSNGKFMALLAEARVVDDGDVYHQSPNKTEKEPLSSKPKYSGSNGRNKRSPKKLIRRQRPRSPSPTSSETSTEDTMTDISPLLSPDIRSLQSLDLNYTEVEGSLKEQPRESVPSSGLSNIHPDEDTDPDVDECSLSSDSQLGVKLLYNCPGRTNRKNYTFTNEKVRNIDRENQRLLRELSRISSTPRPGKAKKKSHTANNLPIVRLSHSALNRQREQQRIERDNLAFLKRLESAKPSTGLKRSEQLADYHRQVGYFAAPPSLICTSTSPKERSTSRTSSGR
ncbi:hypothetical protein PAMA_016441 [Pampus argenteus]